MAPKAGFCFGVKRAMDIALNSIKEGNNNVYTYGSLIHNQHVVNKLASLGLKKIEDPHEIAEGKVIIRSHGVGPKTLELIQARGLTAIDATCPFVKKAQTIAQELDNEGFQVIVIGDKDHPEVKGIVEWTHDHAIVVKDPREVRALPFFPKIGVLAQTTLDYTTFEEITELLKEKTNQLQIHNTICSATKIRQQEAFNLAKTVDVMIVIGGKHSANTKKLASICQRAGTLTYQIEQASELEPHWFNNAERVGVTAGASTPDWIIEEVVERMTELNEEKNLKQEEVQEAETPEMEDQAANEGGSSDKTEEVDLDLASNPMELHRGDIITGTVVQVNDNEVMVDVGGKSEGIIPLNELANRPVENPHDVVAVGDEVKVFVLRVENEDGHPVLSKRRADRQLAWEVLENALESGEELRAPAIEVVKGGLLVDVGVRGFVPASLVERGYVEDLSQYIGKELRLRVIELDRSKNKVVLSQKAILDEEYEKLREATWASLAEGQVIKGIVRRLTDFGAFVDIGGVDGLLHVSELSWGRVEHPRDVLSEGQEIEVKVLAVDRESERVSLGLKQLLPNPWDTAEERYPVGSIVKGKVLRIASFGAFVEVEPGIEGLVHISQLANHHVAKTEDVVSVGEEIPVKVLSVDQDAHRMSLSLKEARGAERPQTTKPAEPVKEEETSGVKLGDIFGDLFEENSNI